MNQRGSVSVILASVFGLFFVASAGFGVWAFSERQSYKNDVDAKIEKATATALAAAEVELDAKFAEKEKLPTKTYTGPATYGSLSFEYPKTWSVYVVESASGTVLDVYASPNYVPGVGAKETSYALRATIQSRSYNQSVEEIDRFLEDGTLQAQAFRAAKVPDVLGLRADGVIAREKTGAAVFLPLRDKTIYVATEAPQFVNDFNTIILPSLTFIP